MDKEIEQNIGECEKGDMEIHTIQQENFPERLLEIPQPPRQLYIRGTMPASSLRMLCVVGSRKHSSYGEEVCKQLISGLKGYAICIVSGLAIGIDAIAHRAALDAGLVTIAFPGSGLDDSVLHPQSNRRLAQEILYSGGALISEFGRYRTAAKWTFPRRNRLMAGISEMTLIIEACQKSGTLITARMAHDYNRDVGAVPGLITSALATGPNKLIRDGAIPITCSDDILEAFGFKNKEEREEIEKQKLKDLKNKIWQLPLGLTENEIDILEYIHIEAHTSEQLVLKTDLSVREINEAVSSLEIQGIIESVGGKFIYIQLKK